MNKVKKSFSFRQSTSKKSDHSKKEAILPIFEENLQIKDGENTLLPQLQNNERVMKEFFDGCSDIVFREIKISHSRDGLVVFVDGIINSEQLHENAIRPLLSTFDIGGETFEPEVLEKNQIWLSQFSQLTTFSETLQAVLSGNAVVFVDGYAKALSLNVIGGKRRGVEEPETEVLVRGPREGFTENLRTNTALLRFRIKSPRLKTNSLIIGSLSRTNVVLAYMDGLADPKVIAEATDRLKRIKIDGVLESGYIEELITDQPYSPFPQLQYTERPDTVASHLLEGRFAIFVDGTPFVLTAPVTAWQMLQASEDYYQQYYISNFIRWLRITFTFIGLFTPALYVAVSTYHQDMLPTTLLLSVAAAREAIPFPAIVEALIMELSFEALREAGIRLPRSVGQALSILGALVIGQAAVQAGIVSAPMVIIVSITGIASFTIPKFNFSIAIRLLRFPLMMLAAAFGLFGIMIGTVWIAIHLCQLRSFGVPYLSGAAPFMRNEMKDILIRTPWWAMIRRPASFSDQNRKRMRDDQQPSP